MKWFIKSRVLFSTVTRVLTLVCRFPDLGQWCLAVNLDLSRRIPHVMEKSRVFFSCFYGQGILILSREISWK